MKFKKQYLIIVYICGYLQECVSEQRRMRQNKQNFNNCLPHEINCAIQKAKWAGCDHQVHRLPMTSLENI